MNTQFTLFTQIEPYYTRLVEKLAGAQSQISMMYLTFDHGEWAQKIAAILSAKAACMPVRLMVDAIGLITDEPRHLFRNREMLKGLQQAGVQVDFFNANRHGLNLTNRLHCKFCAIDDGDVLLGGSNIGDYYLSWSDTNLHMQGSFGSAFHDLYAALHSFTQPALQPTFDPTLVRAGEVSVLLTVPALHNGIRQGLLDLIRSAQRALYLRTWYFLPDEEILQALQCTAESGVQVRIMLSHHTRVPLVDLANYLPTHRLVQSGVQVYRYTGQYMHAKLAWNDDGQVLLGSANLDARSMRGNFESCVLLDNPALAEKLRQAFHKDLHTCIQQTPALHAQRSLPGKFASYACNLTRAWL